jgi:hypothetical protein
MVTHCAQLVDAPCALLRFHHVDHPIEHERFQASTFNVVCSPVAVSTMGTFNGVASEFPHQIPPVGPTVASVSTK